MSILGPVCLREGECVQKVDNNGKAEFPLNCHQTHVRSSHGPNEPFMELSIVSHSLWCKFALSKNWALFGFLRHVGLKLRLKVRNQTSFQLWSLKSEAGNWRLVQYLSLTKEKHLKDDSSSLPLACSCTSRLYPWTVFFFMNYGILILMNIFLTCLTLTC